MEAQRQQGLLPFLLHLLSARIAAAQASPDPAAAQSNGLLYLSVFGGAAAVLVVCGLYCWFDRRSMQQQYEIRALKEQARGFTPGAATSTTDATGVDAGAGAGPDGASDPGWQLRTRDTIGYRGGGSDKEEEGEFDDIGRGSILDDDDAEAFGNGVGPEKAGLKGTRLSAGLEYLRDLPDLRMPRLPGIRAVVPIDGVDISFKPGEHTNTPQTAAAPRASELGELVVDGGSDGGAGGGGSSIVGSSNSSAP